MTKIQFYKLYKKLKEYKIQYNVPDEHFQKIFMEKITENLHYFYGWLYDNSKVEAICRIIINCLLTTDLDFSYIKHLNMKNTDINISDIFGSLNVLTDNTNNGLDIDFNNKYIQQELQCIIEVCIAIIQKLNYNVYECLNECIKAYTSRIMIYSKHNKEYQQEQGAISLAHAITFTRSEEYKNKFIKNTQETDEEYIFTLADTSDITITEELRVKKNYYAVMKKELGCKIKKIY